MFDPFNKLWLWAALTFLGWIVTAMGWLVANFQANKREKRKELRAEIDRVILTVHGLLEAARQYYTKAGDDREDARLRIHTLINRASGQIELLDRHQDDPKVQSRFVSLYEAITNGDFESKDLKPAPLSGERYTRIAFAAENLVSKIEEWYCRNR